MRNRDLHDALRAFALEAAALLREAQDAGAELEFDLEEGSRRGGPSLYHYRPLTAKFVSDRWSRLRSLPGCLRAASALGAGAEAYLRANGLRGGEAEPALRAMLERLYEDATDLSFPEDRFERVYAEVERTLYEHSRPATVLAPLYGLELEADRVELGDGLALVRGGRTDAPDEALWGDPADEEDRAVADGARREPNVLVTLTREVGLGDSLAPVEARDRFARLVTGLRLWKPGGLALSALAWRRTGDGLWQPFELQGGGPSRGPAWVLAADEEADLRQFLLTIAAARPAGSAAWALSRFEMGCGRRHEAEALSDHLLALRALLDAAADPAGSSLALRVAVLCAEEGERKLVQRRVELAQALERFVMGDAPDEDDYFDAIGSDSPRTLVDEVERHLRALLRDVLCGYLDPDLRALSDDLLLEQQPQTPAAPIAPQLDPDPDPEPEPEPEQRDVTTEIEAIESAAGEIGVTATDPAGAAYDWDDDPAGYSAPV